MNKAITKFKIIEHFIDKELNIECGIYEINTKIEHYFVVQTGDDFKAIIHSTDKTNMCQIREDRIEEIRELLKNE